MKELEHRIYFKMTRIYSLKFLDNKKYNGIRNPSTNGIHHSQKQFSQNNLVQNIAKTSLNCHSLSKIEIEVQKHQTQALYKPIRSGQAKSKVQNQ